MNKKIQVLIVVLLVVAAFLAGSAGAKVKYGGSKIIPTPTISAAPSPIPFNPKKSLIPEVKFFVMSFCPYGNQAEAGLELVYQLLKDKATWSPRYIINDKKASCEQNCPYRIFNSDAESRCDEAIKQGQIKDMDTCKTYFPYTSTDECLTKECAGLKAGEYESLHGQVELNQDIREICAFNLGNLDKWWKFVSLTNEKCNSTDADTCWNQQATGAGLNTTQISTCAESQKVTLVNKEITEAEKYQASGSPMVFINDTVYNGGRAPEDYKKAICLAFENPPEECSTVLGEETAAASEGCE
ncbi:hypothetical protein COS55_01730 [Candidatus Shapirobacteria bacterium CG03_land_8_20_14_0_80_40_19]|uniref:Thioredoxin-like fold domain-containing protein n=4 Tax=Patescibacteria group TaxID=1783273 RepID=A0A2M7BED5_9BACT|nr:MAG: hypothetical protein COV89_03415 [Candidatus Shapirobacteria bacterium CG11_big_fil_rev_8_21_14_0_20_40_12]PIV01471.1 MAG: hypothetical protein COS55_01730 [Candidatus Shapirobacteria bacterium CG03_land_8_20_14_0_80_40_19]PIZ56794.1 MAG: hypothetical protein COY22_00105 [Candidatus Tagabacteria bacterium CG_4_10_14_0_2_um_filter_40_13]PJC29055.1 MAG: hypothetical protein CO053_01335 [Candidatus Shapirobacteria bacterium CG_4_9_14_0_2_um_filter_40_11]PJC69962.1 MAG: hypothetical protein